MFASNICRRICANKSLSFYGVSKTASSGIRRRFGDSSGLENGNAPSEKKVNSNERKGTNQGKGNKLYKISKNDKNVEAQVKLEKLKMEAKRGTEYGSEGQIKMAHPQNKGQRITLEAKDKFPSRKLDREIFISAKKVAKNFGGDARKTQNDLLTFYNSINNRSKGVVKSQPKKVLTEEDKEATLKIHNILVSINNVDEGIDDEEDEQWQYDEKKSQRLNIFNENIEWERGTEMLLWDRFQREELRCLGTISPRNFYEEMILWTEQGRLWHFPIDNEQGMDEEAKISFSEHVFLEHKLEPWCPKSGPLRHFMELVLVGLSKNYHLTVQQKHEHIDWFRDYFENKRKLLTEVGAFADKTIST